VEPLHDAVVTDDVLAVKRSKPFEFDRAYTRHGVVIASDRGHGLVFTLGWTGFEPGAAPELGALAIDRASSIAELREAVTQWKMPVVDVVYADGSTVGRQISGQHGHRAPPAAESIPIAANENVARTNRLSQMLAGSAKYTIDDAKRQQHDVMSWNAGQLVPRLAALHATDATAEKTRLQLLAWDRRVTAESPAAAVYVRWERRLWRRIAETRVPAPLVDGYLGHVPFDVSQVLNVSDGDLFASLAEAAR